MKLLFKDSDFLVIIGAAPFDNIKETADCVIRYIEHMDAELFVEELSYTNAIAEFASNDVINKTDDEETNYSDLLVSRKITLKSIGDGKFDANDNDKLHAEWISAFRSVLRSESIDYWTNIINKDTP